MLRIGSATKKSVNEALRATENKWRAVFTCAQRECFCFTFCHGRWLVLSCPVLSWVCLVLSFRGFGFVLGLSCSVLFCFLLSYLVLSWACPVQSWACIGMVLSCPVLGWSWAGPVRLGVMSALAFLALRPLVLLFGTGRSFRPPVPSSSCLWGCTNSSWLLLMFSMLHQFS